jgi:hypothetical protein
MENFEGYGSPQPAGPSPEQLKALQTYEAAKQERASQKKQILEQGIQNRNQTLEARPTSSKPLYLDINAVPTGLESIGAGAKIDLGGNQNLNFGGMYTPGYTEQGVSIPQGYTVRAGYETNFGNPNEGARINVNYRNSRRGMDSPGGGSFDVEAMLNKRF